MGTSMNYFECCHHCVAPKRYPGCSGSCPEYKEARARYDADKAKHNTDTILDYYHSEKIINSKNSIAQYKRRRPRSNFF